MSLLYKLEQPATETLAERIEKLRADLDAWIDERARREAADCPGIPLDAIRGMLTYHSNCQCAVTLHLLKKDAES